MTFIYLVFCECSLKVRRSNSLSTLTEVITDDSDAEEAVFQEPPADLLDDDEGGDYDNDDHNAGKSDSIDVPRTSKSRGRSRSGATNSLPSNTASSLASSYHLSLPHSFFNETS